MFFNPKQLFIFLWCLLLKYGLGSLRKTPHRGHSTYRPRSLVRQSALTPPTNQPTMSKKSKYFECFWLMLTIDSIDSILQKCVRKKGKLKEKDKIFETELFSISNILLSYAAWKQNIYLQNSCLGRSLMSHFFNSTFNCSPPAALLMHAALSKYSKN